MDIVCGDCECSNRRRIKRNVNDIKYHCSFDIILLVYYTQFVQINTCCKCGGTDIDLEDYGDEDGNDKYRGNDDDEGYEHGSKGYEEGYNDGDGGFNKINYDAYEEDPHVENDDYTEESEVINL